MSQASGWLAFLAALSGAIVWSAPRADRDEHPRGIDFGRDVQPILAANCVRCHGPDKSKGDLRLDLRSRALGGASPAIVAGDAAGSALFQRVTSDDPEERMPLGAQPLAREQIDTLRTWIEQGAPWPDEYAGRETHGRDHWAYKPPVRPGVPPVAQSTWARNPIDAFVLERVEHEGLAPAPEADRATLIRRLSLDLCGLPPTPEDVAAFVADRGANAYDQLVERLLASPHYGERMARGWLDLARYADTHGYEKDARRTMWRYRDWVIGAFNANLPFDEFTVEQLAGDLLPNATLEQRIATGFHRNTMLNEEGGTDPEEFRVDAVIDRVNTTATVWLGSTLMCAQCHDHKFDPFTQRDYYRLFAVFNSTADSGKDSAPSIPAPTPDQAREQARLAQLSVLAQRAFEGPDAALDADQARWERDTIALLPPPTQWRELAPLSATATPAGPTLTIRDDGSVLVGGASPERVDYRASFRPVAQRFNVLRIEALADPSLPSGGPGRSDNGNFVLSTLQVELEDAGREPQPLHFVTGEGDVEQRPGPYRAAQALDDGAETGWAIDDFARGVDHEAVFVLAAPLELDGRQSLVVTLQSESKWARHTLGRFRVSLADDAAIARRLTEPALSAWRAVGPFQAASTEAARDTAFEPELEHLRGAEYSPAYGDLAWIEHTDWPDRTMQRLEGEHCATYLERRIVSQAARKLELFLGGDDAIRVWLNGAPIYKNDDYESLVRQEVRVEVELRAGENRLLYKIVNATGGYGFYFDIGRKTDDQRSAAVERALRVDAARRDAEQTAAVRDYFRRNVDARGRELWRQLEALRAEQRALAEHVPTALVMSELATPRESHVFVRGSFLSPGEPVEPGIPALFGELDTRGEPVRLAFARWLASDSNPLVARVTVNRLWEQLFGRGLVATGEDFGTRSDPPTHPQLLDWLAVDFVEHGWDVKALLRTIVSSATYRQSSDASELSRERDPFDALLSRGARFRVEGEMLRDVALATSGLLVDQIGGPSVFPPQPPGLWNSAYSSDDWKNAAGASRWRRGLYTFWKRTAPYATFALFEAPSREVICTRRPRTNTPLQALALLDDPAFVEAHVALARRMLREAPASDEARARRGFELCTSRAPTDDELGELVELARAARDEFTAAPERARARAEDSGELDPVEVAAWTSVASVLLNLDETLTRH